MNKFPWDNSLKIIHLNTNMWIKWVRKDIKQSLYWTLAFFIESSPENIYNNCDIEQIITPYLRKWWDIIWFSEVFWIKNLNIVISLLEKYWYNVHYTDAFEMWNQNMQWEHLYNVVWIKKDLNTNWPKIVTKVYSQRKLSWITLRLKNLLSWNFVNNSNLYNRLVNWILDGAISSFVVDWINITHLHIHWDNPIIWNYFLSHISDNAPNVMFWDFNIWNLDSFLLTPPFSWKWYKKFLSDEHKTYSFAKWLSLLPLIRQPDNVIWNSFTNNLLTTSSESLSDHNWIVSNVSF